MINDTIVYSASFVLNNAVAIVIVAADGRFENLST